MLSYIQNELTAYFGFFFTWSLTKYLLKSSLYRKIKKGQLRDKEKRKGVFFLIRITRVDYFSEVELIFLLACSTRMQWKENIRLWFCGCELKCNQASRGNDDKTRFLPTCPVEVRKFFRENLLPWIPFQRLCFYFLMKRPTAASAKGLRFRPCLIIISPFPL